MSNFQFIKDLSAVLYDTWNNAVLMWENRNSSTYTFLQQFIERFIILLYVNKNKRGYLGDRPNLGSLLDLKLVRNDLQYDLGLSLNDIELISEINKSGNSAKHGLNAIDFLDDKAIRYFELCYRIISRYQHQRGISNIPAFSSNLLKRKEENQFREEVQIKVTETSTYLVNELNEKIKSLERIIAGLDAQNRKLAVETSQVVKPNIELDSLKSKYAEAVDRYEKQLALLESKPEDLKLQSKIEEYGDLIDDLEIKINQVKQKSEITPEVLIKNNELTMESAARDLQQITEKKKQIGQFVTTPKKHPYYDYSSLLNFISLGFNSCYGSNCSFSLKGVDDTDRSRSKLKSFYAVIFNQLIRGKNIRLSSYLDSLNYSSDEYNLIYKVEISFLSMLRNGLLEDNIWTINVINIPEHIISTALNDLQNRLNQLESLVGKDKSNIQCSQTFGKLVHGQINLSLNVIYPTEPKCITIVEDYRDDNLTHLWIEELIQYKVDSKNHDQINVLVTLINEFFGFKDFLEGQLEILANVMNGKNTIGILTTGGGKSLIYQFAGLMQPKLTVIVDPINALINDQYRKLVEELGVDRVLRVIKTSNEGVEVSAKSALQSLVNRPPLFTFTSPERFQNEDFRNWLIAQSSRKQIGLIVLDEVHCLSEWGHDFRVSYLMLTHTINAHCANFQYLGLTATAAINVIKDLQVELNIFDKESIVFSRKLQRDNLDFNVIKFSTYAQMKEALSRMLQEDYNNPKFDFHVRKAESNAIIVFFKVKTQLNALFEEFKVMYRDELTLFSGDVKNTQDDFIYNRKTLLFSTNAFGMGIDKPNVRKTVHFGMPASKEAYFQEAGRAGRDGNPSSCLLMTFETDPVSKMKIDRFLNLTTSIDDLLKLQMELGNVEDNDLSVIAYFLTKDLDTPVNEAERAVRVFDYIRTRQKNKSIVLTLPDAKDTKRLQRLQNDLYILHKLGAIRTWTIKYSMSKVSGLLEVELSVYLESAFSDFNHMKLRVINYLTQYAPNPRLISDIEDLTTQDGLVPLITKMREWYQSTFIRSRREQLANMVEFIDRYKNSQRNDDIQNEMSQFFDISRLLERRESEKSLTFTNSTITTLVRRAAKLDEAELNELRITMERLLETEESNKINMFTGLINLRISGFDNRNGRERLLMAIRQSSEEEVIDFYRSSKAIYDSLNLKNKLVFLDFIQTNNPYYFYHYAFNNEVMDDFIAPYYIRTINHLHSDLI